MSHRTTTFSQTIATLRRFGAACGVALFFLLTVSAASPSLHHWLHCEGTPDASDSCAVVLFAAGVTLACGAMLVSGASQDWTVLTRSVVGEILLIAPRYVLRPERGPPVS